MKFTDLSEDIIDDILADFPELRSRRGPDSENFKQPKFTPQPSKSREPIKIQGIKHEDFSRWVRSKEQVRKALQENLNTTKITLKNCIALYTEYNIKIDDYVVLEFPTKSVYPYREYDRDIDDKGWTGKMTQEEYAELVKDVATNGIQQPGILDIYNLKDGNYEVQLGEGNHRLKIALQLGVEKFPLSFSYRFG